MLVKLKPFWNFQKLAGGKHFHSWFLSQFSLFLRGTPQTAPFALKFRGVQLEKYTKQFQVVGWVYTPQFYTF